MLFGQGSELWYSVRDLSTVTEKYYLQNIITLQENVSVIEILRIYKYIIKIVRTSMYISQKIQEPFIYKIATFS